eukprot:TRINITY_DN55994_c0_g1_i1.p1 TRINITY_DN55994_c0_g1~~TRINITY_DN55994_c0_g1_i1.p1  ORF type:complete len:174 (-),score=34.69 TRINITY_DN55994_c0_g1_i1:103-624(-)
MSKLNQEQLRSQIAEVFERKGERKFTQSIDLQVLLRDFNANASGVKASIDVLHPVRSKLNIIVIPNTAHRDECIANNIPFRELDDLKKNKSDKQGIKKWARKYDRIFVSSDINRKVVKLIGKLLSSVKKLPVQVAEGSSVESKIEQQMRTITFKTQKNSWVATSIGVETQDQE